MSKDESFEFFVSVSSLLVVILHNLVLLVGVFKNMCNAHTATNQVFKLQTLKLSVEMMGEHLKTHTYIPKKEALEEGRRRGNRSETRRTTLIVTNVKSCCQTDQGHFFAPSKRP